MTGVFDWYLLDDDHNVIGTTDDMDVAWFNKRQHHRVAVTKVSHDCEVSTVFLGLNYSFTDGPPILFETLVLGGPFDEEMDRYATWAEAEAGHARMVERCQMEKP